MLYNLLFISFTVVSTDSIDNLGGDEFDEGGGVGGAPKDVEGGPDSISGPTGVEEGPISGPTEVEEGPTSGPTEAKGGPNFGPKEAKEASDSGPKEAEIGTRAGITFSELIFTLSLFKFAGFVEMMTLLSSGVTFSEIVFTFSVFKFADLVELTFVFLGTSTVTSVSGGASSDLTSDIWIFLAFIECKLACCLRIFVVG